MAQRRHPEWLSELETTKYPFEDGSSLINEQGRAILEGTFLDASIHPIGAVVGMYLAKVTVTNTTTELVIGDANSESVASVTYTSTSPPNQLRLTDDHGRPAGMLLSDPIRLAIFSLWGIGEYTFNRLQTPFAVSVCVPLPEVGVRGLLLDDGNIVTGDIWLVGDDGIVLTCEDTTEDKICVNNTASFRTIGIHAIGDPLFRRRLCASPGLFSSPQFLETICMVSPGKPGIDNEPTVSGSADILILTDTTGSMYSYIDVLKAIFPQVVAGVIAELPDSSFRWAVADYRDFEDGGDYVNGWKIDQIFDPDPNLAYSAINGLTTGGGGDAEEQNISALKLAAESWETLLAGRSSAAVPRAIIWGGDVPGWEDGAKGNPYPALQTAIDTLENAGVLVFALNSANSGAGLDGVPSGEADGRNQASAIVETVGGAVHNNVNTASTEQITQLLIDAIIYTDGTTPNVPSVAAQRFCCGPGEFGDVKITVGTQDSPDSILRIRPTKEGLVFEAVGERMEDIR